jgi:hypothetical protein
MTYSTFARNAMITANPTTHLSAHTAYSSTGTNEVTGGTPAYARKAVTYGAAAAEAKTASGTPVFDIPTGTTVRFIGMWDALTAGNFLGMIANGGNEQEFAVDIATENRIKLAAHGWVATQKVVFTGDTPPAPLVEGTVYFVAGVVNTNDFQVSATSGGAAITLTAEPGRKCVISAIVEETFGAQGTLTVNTHTLRLDA